jgi:pantetheine-phosphate adenylyltransferase
VETVFLTPAEQYTFISASIVREVARFDGDVSKFVSPSVVVRLKEKYKR